jgi:hypothetical protein
MNAWRLWGQLSAGLLIAAVGVLPATADELIFYPTDDAWADEYTPNHCYGSHDKMGVRNTSYGPWESHSLVRFDISSIPPGTEIPSATLYLYYFLHWDNSPAGRPLSAYRITSDWDEETVNWNRRPSHASQVTSYAAVPSWYTWMAWDVTNDVQAFVNGDEEDYGWTIIDETFWPGSGIPFTFFRTKEYGSYIPYLEVVPEPGTLGLLLLGSLVILSRRR